MTFLDYITITAPAACGVHPACGETARLIFNSEKEDNNSAFAAGKFSDTRERAEMCLPYQVADVAAREHALDVVELAICTHRQAEHEEKHADRIALLEVRPMSDEEREMATRDWWNS